MVGGGGFGARFEEGEERARVAAAGGGRVVFFAGPAEPGFVPGLLVELGEGGEPAVKEGDAGAGRAMGEQAARRP